MGKEVRVLDIGERSVELAPEAEYVWGDVRRYEEVYAALEDVDEIYDLAGILGTSELHSLNQRAIEVNILGAVNVLDAARQRGVERIFHPTKPNDWLNTYSITKYAAENFCRLFEQLYGMKIAVLRWFNAYGPKQHVYPIRKAVPTFIIQALHNRPLTVFGDGSQLVDMIHAKDVAKIAIHLTGSDQSASEIIDIGSGLSITVNQLARMIIDIAESNSDIQHLPMRSGEPLSSKIEADSIPLQNVYDEPIIGLEEGLKETIDYYRKLDQTTVDLVLREFCQENK